MQLRMCSEGKQQVGNNKVYLISREYEIFSHEARALGLILPENAQFSLICITRTVCFFFAFPNVCIHLHLITKQFHFFNDLGFTTHFNQHSEAVVRIKEWDQKSWNRSLHRTFHGRTPGTQTIPRVFSFVIFYYLVYCHKNDLPIYLLDHKLIL